MSATYHVPVLFDASLDGLALQPGGTYVDCTFGGGGHSRGILDRLGPEGRLFGFDCDPDAADNVPDDPRFQLIPENFRFASNFLRLHGVRHVDGILADLGVSSHQFDAEDRGFSTRGDGGLDMRMDPRLAEGADALLAPHGRRRIDPALPPVRRTPPARTRPPGPSSRPSRKRRATPSPQGGFKRSSGPSPRPTSATNTSPKPSKRCASPSTTNWAPSPTSSSASLRLLKPGGRLVVISYHSLEDRMVKRFMRAGNLEGDIQKGISRAGPSSRSTR